MKSATRKIFHHPLVTSMDHSRIFATNISSAVEEVRPHVEHPGVSYGTLVNVQGIENSVTDSVSPLPGNFVIDIDEQPSTSLNDGSTHDTSHHHRHETSATYNLLGDTRETANEAGDSQTNDNTNNVISHSNSNNDVDETSAEAVQISQRLCREVKRYVPLLLILFLKGLYDHRTNILNFIVLIVTFNYSNNVVKREIAKQNNKSWLSLLIITCYIVGCIVFIHFEYETHIFSPYTQPLTIWELLWSVLITDFVLKLITIIFKVLVTCLPSKILALRKRGKYFFMVEATSQLYRCVAPAQSWLYYLYESYQGPEKIVGIFLSLLYTVTKGPDLLSRIRLFQTAVWKLLQNVNLGVSPSKEQLIASGGICAICHGEYSTPVRLHCKHIFCETCVVTWLNRECSCPLCRATITDDPIYRDGHTTHFIQVY
ncbi:RING finger and transmembrane domain-containing protein 2 isoform X2 [Ceratina calcarata]|uniref:RING finger and transmembrane domain-containing protein 2 isoform X2 n=1 Tax=Ceratina calcarata TaxID=156304 RepID=A0AAJ7NEA9_9HYME|nr:RING finger and transmembrane domain-containing protein 2 isoform X2 [Ceratina calcarata]